MASGSAEPKIRGQRQGHAKVKSGCLTCKIRRVKCDETKPSCLRCTGTGRKCDGYKGQEPLKFINTTTKIENPKWLLRDAASPRSSNCASRLTCSRLIGSPQNPLLDFSGTEMEHRSFDFFRYEAAPALSGYFDADLWSILLPRVGYSEPPVQHALIALGSLYEHSKDNESYPSVVQQRYALIQYNKAIRALKSCKVDDPKTLEVTLMTCLLFVCLELLAGNPEQALNHLQNGLGILRNSRRAKDRTSSLHQRNRGSSRRTLPGPRSVIEVLSDAFSRLSIQSSMCSRRLPEIYPSEGWSIVEDPQSARIPFNNLQDARLSLNEIFVQCFQPKSPLEKANNSSGGTNAAEKGKEEILVEQLHFWNSRLGLYVTDSLPNLPQEEIKGSHILRLLSIIAIIWNTTTENPLESEYDAHFDSHQTVISLALSFIQESTASPSATTATLSSGSTTPTLSRSNDKQVPLGTFTFEMGVIPALYFTAIKCRHPSLRRKALDMLRRVMPQREGLWDARLLAAIAQRVIEIEEADGCSEERWPAEARRIHGIYITPNHCPVERKQDVVFTWRPGGPAGDWLQMFDKVVY